MLPGGGRLPPGFYGSCGNFERQRAYLSPGQANKMK